MFQSKCFWENLPLIKWWKFINRNCLPTIWQKSSQQKTWLENASTKTVLSPSWLLLSSGMSLKTKLWKSWNLNYLKLGLILFGLMEFVIGILPNSWNFWIRRKEKSIDRILFTIRKRRTNLPWWPVFKRINTGSRKMPRNGSEMSNKQALSKNLNLELTLRIRNATKNPNRKNQLFKQNRQVHAQTEGVEPLMSSKENFDKFMKIFPSFQWKLSNCLD